MLSAEKSSREKKKVLRKQVSTLTSTNKDSDEALHRAHLVAAHPSGHKHPHSSGHPHQPSSLSPRQEWWIIFFVRLLAYAIPLSFLLYVLYYNYLPFGYDKTFVINVGEPGDTDSSKEFYLQPAKGLSEATTTINADGSTSTARFLDGIAYAVFRPNAVLDDATVTVSVEGDEGVSLIPPVIDFDPASTTWDYMWDFSTSTPPDFQPSTSTSTSTSTPVNTTNTAFHFEDGMYFDGNSKLELASSSDMFEDGPFTVYAEWTPEDSENNFQQIVGHYNWEILQNKKSVSFQVTTKNNTISTSITNNKISQIIYNFPQESFFKEKHTLLAEYNLSTTTYSYIMLIVDGKFVDKINLLDYKIDEDYNKKKNLSIGLSVHGIAHPFLGTIHLVSISNTSESTTINNYELRELLEENKFPITSTLNDNQKINFIRLKVKKNGIFKKNI